MSLKAFSAMDPIWKIEIGGNGDHF